MKVYLDDERPAPDGWILVKTVEEAVKLLMTRQVVSLSLDNDLGMDQLEGHSALDFLESEVYFDPTFPIPEITIHSANSTRVEDMKRAVESINRIRQKQLQQDINNE